MNKEELLKKINNPLDNNELLESILKSYYNDHDIYNDLVKLNTEGKEIGFYNKKDRDEYNLYLFNIWKNNILNYDLNNIVPKDRNVFTKLQKAILFYEPKTTEDINNFIYNLEGMHDLELEKYLEENAYTSQGEFTGWEHVSNEYLSFFNEKTPKIKHRLYLNINSTFIDKFAKIFTEKCYENNLPFYYKYESYSNRADSFVIYSDSKNLLKYINILEEIKKELPIEIENNIKKPPIISANIDNWIGYGSEPQINTDKKYSYSSLREKIIEDVLNKFNEHWTNTHINKEVTINGERIPYKELLSNLIYETYIENYEKQIKNKNNPDEVNKYTGYSLNDTRKEGFRKNLKTIIYKNMDYIIENINNLDELEEDKLYRMKTRIDNKLLVLDGNMIKKALKKQPYLLSKESKNFNDQFRNAIKREAVKYNISEENFCFDKLSLKEIIDGKEYKVKPTVKKIDINNKAFKKQEVTVYSLKKDQIIQDIPYKTIDKNKTYTTTKYKNLTEEEIETARIRLGFKR